MLFPKKKRKYVYAIYVFARTADDIADSVSLSSEEKLTKLNELENLLSSEIIPQDENMKSMIVALRDTIKREKLGNTDFLNLLKAFKQDSVKSRYKSFGELLEYSKYSANPIGRLVLKILGYDENHNSCIFAYSDNICTALQLINFWQDVSRDLDINRIYIPADILGKYSYSYEDLFNKRIDDRYIGIIKELIEKTEEIIRRGIPLAGLLNGRQKFEFKAIYNGGIRILQKIRGIGFKTLSERVKLSGKDKIIIIFKAIFFRIESKNRKYQQF